MKTKEEYIKSETAMLESKMKNVPKIKHLMHFHNSIDKTINDLQNLSDEEYEKIVMYKTINDDLSKIENDDLSKKLKMYGITLEEFDSMSEEEFIELKKLIE